MKLLLQRYIWPIFRPLTDRYWELLGDRARRRGYAPAKGIPMLHAFLQQTKALLEAERRGEKGFVQFLPAVG